MALVGLSSSQVGFLVGDPVGLDVGLLVGAAVGNDVGLDVGLPVGAAVGNDVGLDVGLPVCAAEGNDVGLDIGLAGRCCGRPRRWARCWPAGMCCRLAGRFSNRPERTNFSISREWIGGFDGRSHSQHKRARWWWRRDRPNCQRSEKLVVLRKHQQ